MTHWITTWSGHTFDANDPRPEDLHAVDFAHALGNLCRFTGHTSRFYSVLEHSLFVLRIGRDRYPDAPPEVRLALLLHDAPEAYINDLSTPVKALVGDGYRAVEDKYVAAITARMGLPADAFTTDVVKDCDHRALKAEAWDLLRDHGVTGGINHPSRPPRDHYIKATVPDPNDLRLEFLSEILHLQRAMTLTTEPEENPS